MRQILVLNDKDKIRLIKILNIARELSNQEIIDKAMKILSKTILSEEQLKLLDKTSLIAIIINRNKQLEIVYKI